MWPKCPDFTLADGRVVRLIQMIRENIYHSLLAGAPSRGNNFGKVQHFFHLAENHMGWALGQRPPIILPFPICEQKAKEWKRSNLYEFEGLPPLLSREEGRVVGEWMPGVGTAALFTSDPIRDDPKAGDSSYLSVIWFQRGFESLIEEEPLNELKQIDWDGLANSWLF